MIESQTKDKFQSQAFVAERFDMFVGLVLLTLSSERKIEPANYEDLVRELLGKDAYLLFVYDKLI